MSIFLQERFMVLYSWAEANVFFFQEMDYLVGIYHFESIFYVFLRCRKFHEYGWDFHIPPLCVSLSMTFKMSILVEVPVLVWKSEFSVANAESV